jgi:hypothetical protein
MSEDHKGGISFFMAVLLFTIDAIVSASVFVPLGNLLFD